MKVWTRRVWRIPIYLGFGGLVVTVEPWTWRGIRRRFR